MTCVSALRVLAVAAAVGGWVTGSLLAREPAEDPVGPGRDLYRICCASCHGPEGRGDGPIADVLKVPATDLTKLVKRNGGAFPVEAVSRAIDGRRPVRAHGSPRMPVWGLTFQDLDRDTNQEEEVRGRILQLIRFLESIQERSP